jgi:hypothetical protein
MRLQLQRIVLPSLFIAWIAIVATTSRDALAFGGTARELEHQGNFAITNNAGFGFSHQIGHGDGTTFSLRPGLDYFIIENLSIGGAIQFDFASAPPNVPNASSSTNVILAPEVGYELALTDTWSLWPMASVSMQFPSSGNPLVAVNVSVAFLVHPAEHFFFGIGPALSQDITSNPNTFISGFFRIGGYFDH